jgi:hypothetical protein
MQSESRSPVAVPAAGLDSFLRSCGFPLDIFVLPNYDEAAIMGLTGTNRVAAALVGFAVAMVVLVSLIVLGNT